MIRVFEAGRLRLGVADLAAFAARTICLKGARMPSMAEELATDRNTLRKVKPTCLEDADHPPEALACDLSVRAMTPRNTVVIGA